MKYIAILYVTILLASCEHKVLPKHEVAFKNLTSDSSLLGHISAETNALNLSKIMNGVDSFELRIWYGITIVTPKQLVILTCQDSTWNLSRTDYWLRSEDKIGSPDQIIADSSFTRSLNVPTDILSVVDSIYQLRLDTFPSQKQIHDFYGRVADGMFYVIELATPHYYKALAYNNPERYSDYYDKHIAQLVSILKRIGVD